MAKESAMHNKKSEDLVADPGATKTRKRPERTAISIWLTPEERAAVGVYGSRLREQTGLACDASTTAAALVRLGLATVLPR